MSFRGWSRDEWTLFVSQSRIPEDIVSDEVGRSVDYGYIDSAENKRRRDTIAERCDLVGGIVLGAERLGYINLERALVVVGDGATATIATRLAILREIPVVHVRTQGVDELSPFRDCHTRWISPTFFETLLGDRIGHSWHWRVPQGFGFLNDADLARMDGFHYAHETAADVAERWIKHGLKIAGDYSHFLQEVRLERHELDMATVDGEVRWRVPMGAEIGLVLECRFFDRENLTLIGHDKKPVFTSFPYFEKGESSVWAGRSGTVVISGGGNGALQDFLRSTWRWDRLDQCAAANVSLVKRQGAEPELQHAAACLEAHFAELQKKWDTQDDSRLEARQKNVDLASAIEDEFKKDYRALHEHAAKLVEKLLPHCHNWKELEAQMHPRATYLFTRSGAFSFSFLHNLFFALLTIRLQEEAKRQPHAKGHDPFPIHYTGPTPCRADDCHACAEHMAQGHFTVTGIAPIETILVRHAPVHAALL